MNRKEKNNYRCIAVFTILVLLTGIAGSWQTLQAKDGNKPRFYIKAKGMLSNATGGDFGTFVDMNSVFFPDLSESPNYDVLVDVPEYFQGFSGEIGFETSRFAVGISGGIIERNFHTDYFYSDSTGLEISYARDQKLTAYPLFLMVHYKIIDTRFLTAFLSLGEGVYITNYRDDRVQTYRNSDRTFLNSWVEANKNSLAFRIGATIDFNITQNIKLFVEGSYRRVKFEELEGSNFFENDDVTDMREGTLLLLTNSRTGEARFDVIEVASSNDWAAIPAVFDLNGFSLSVGIKLIFGKGKDKKPDKVAPQFDD